MKAEDKQRRQVFAGVGLVPGLALGTAFRVEEGVRYYRLRITPPEVEHELERFREALRGCRKQLEALKSRLRSRLGNESSLILDAHLLILRDPYFVNGVQAQITEKLQSPERAVREVCEKWSELYRGLNDPILGDKDSDLEEVGERVISNLLESGSESADTDEKLILVGRSISLSSLAEFQPGQLAGLVTTRGGPASHLTIVARACGIPLVAGIEHVERLVRTGDQLLVDGGDGAVYMNPTQAQLESCQTRQPEISEELEKFITDGKTVTQDGRRIHLYANTEVTDDLGKAVRHGAEGIGLFRCEYLYLGRRDGPISETLQSEIYSDLARRFPNSPVFIRTLDIVDAGHPYFVRLAGEAEPVLGLRGIRLSLRYPEIFRAQLRALLHAAVEGDLRIVLPMITSVEEVWAAREIIHEVHAQLRARGEGPPEVPPVGAMLEVPAAVYAVDSIAAESDFLLVGSNDLMQYTLAVGRNNQRLADLFDPFHPAILASLDRIAQAARRLEQLVVVCGEAATWPRFSALLLGLGFQHLSMAPSVIPRMRRHFSQLDFVEARNLAQRALRASSAQQIRSLLEEALPDVGEGVGLRA